jgi:hypothetical protein
MTTTQLERPTEVRSRALEAAFSWWLLEARLRSAITEDADQHEGDERVRESG